MPKTRPFACDYKNRLNEVSFWVYKQMKLRKMSQSEIAEILEIEQQSVSKKLNPNRKEQFTLMELMKLVDLFKATDCEVLKLIKA